MLVINFFLLYLHALTRLAMMITAQYQHFDI